MGPFQVLVTLTAPSLCETPAPHPHIPMLRIYRGFSVNSIRTSSPTTNGRKQCRQGPCPVATLAVTGYPYPGDNFVSLTFFANSLAIASSETHSSHRSSRWVQPLKPSFPTHSKPTLRIVTPNSEWSAPDVFGRRLRRP